jgi:ATP-dependent Lon protease
MWQCFCRFQERLEPFKDKLPEAVKTVIEDELAKLSGLEQASSEFNVTRNYLDWLTSLPWGQYTEERLDIDHAKQVGTPIPHHSLKGMGRWQEHALFPGMMQHAC